MNRKNRPVPMLGCVFIALVSVLVTGQPSVSQTVTGSIVGTVRDPQGAVIPNASLSAKNLEMGTERSVTSDASGGFSIASIPAGGYSLSIAAPGFQKEVRSGITLTVGAIIRLDFTLNLGALAETVEVAGEAPQVNTTTSTMSGLVSDKVVRELPLNQRDWLQLATLEAGVTTIGNTNGSGATSTGMGMKMSISGSRPNANVYRIDGLVVNDQTNDSPGSVLGGNMGVDAIREFTVLTNTFSAEFGRTSGGVVNAISKSGTNTVHGTAFEFIRNSILDARNFFDIKIPPFRRNQFGGSIGGPIRKNKLFYFGNYEGLRQFLSQSLNSQTLSPNARNGIICANSACTSTTQVAIAPSIKPYLSLFPVANGAINGDTGQFVRGAGQIGHEDYVTAKVDYQVNAQTSLSGSYTFDRASSAGHDAFAEISISNRSRNQRGMLTLQHVFSPSLLNTIRGGINRVVALAATYSNPVTPLLADPSLGFTPGKSVGQVSVPGLGTFSGIDSSGGDLFWYTVPQLNDDLTWIKGRNNIRIGFSVEAIQNNLNSPSSPAGLWQFGSISDFLQAIPLQFQSDFPGTDEYRGLRQKIFGAYIQDDIRLKSNLTFNLGVRYEPSTVVSVANGKAARLLTLSDPQVATGIPLYRNPTLRNFDPRVGLAWDPFGNGRTAIRAGFGMYDVQPLPNLFNLLEDRTAPFFESGNILNPPASSFPNGAFKLLGPTSLTAFYMESTPSRPYKMQWNGNIQRQIVRGLTFMAAYVGSKGVHLPNVSADIDEIPPSYVTNAPDGHYVFPLTRPIPRINPNFQQIRSLFWDGFSTYHSLQANMLERIADRLTLQVAYAWSKSMDNGSVEYSNAELAGSMDSPYRFIPDIQRGLSDFDVRQHVAVHTVWDVPALKSGAMVSRFLLSGWEVSGIFTAQSGNPFSIRLPNDRAGTGSLVAMSVRDGQRPDFVAGPDCAPPTGGDPNRYIHLQCFAYPRAGTLGNLGRNALPGPGLVNLDFSLFKNHSLLHERLKVQFRAEAFNLTNTANFAIRLVTAFTGSGAIIPSQGALLSTTTKSRQLQFGLRLAF
jgi:hypothetical protein